LGGYPRTDFVQILKNSLGQVAPKGLRHVQAMLCGTSANENAIKTAFIHYQTRKRGGKLPSKEDMESCMNNEIPGSPNLCVLGIFLEFLENYFCSFLGFRGSFHGRSLGMLSITRYFFNFYIFEKNFFSFFQGYPQSGYSGNFYL